MSLTLGTGPLAQPPLGHLNADLWTVAPDRALYLHPLDRRIRGELAGEVVVDSTRGWMLHETGLMPRWYLPYDDVREDLLVPSGTRTHCPYKGDASYWSVRVGDRVAEDAMWTYATSPSGWGARWSPRAGARSRCSRPGSVLAGTSGAGVEVVVDGQPV